MCAPHLLSQGSRALKPQLLSPPALEPVLSKKRSHRDEKPVRHDQREPVHGNRDPAQPKEYTVF